MIDGFDDCIDYDALDLDTLKSIQDIAASLARRDDDEVSDAA